MVRLIVEGFLIGLALGGGMVLEFKYGWVGRLVIAYHSQLGRPKGE